MSIRVEFVCTELSALALTIKILPTNLAKANQPLFIWSCNIIRLKEIDLKRSSPIHDITWYPSTRELP
ncbi:unnamed protein product [Debaryomyces fabryi]|nr:unnamed protein product [Debaryomyces fabryi]